MDALDALRTLTEQKSALQRQQSQLAVDMCALCRASDDPAAQDICRRIEVVSAQARLWADLKTFCCAADADIAERLTALSTGWLDFYTDADKHMCE